MFRLKTALVLFLLIAAVIFVLVVGSWLTAAGLHPIAAFIAPILALGLLDEIRRRRKNKPKD